MSRDYRNMQRAMGGGGWVPPDWFEVDEPEEDMSCKICPKSGQRICGDNSALCLICGECEEEE